MKKPRYFYYSQAAGGYVHGGSALAAALGPAAFDYDDKIEFLTCKRIDMTDEELAALPEFDSRKVKPGKK